MSRNMGLFIQLDHGASVFFSGLSAYLYPKLKVDWFHASFGILCVQGRFAGRMLDCQKEVT